MAFGSGAHPGIRPRRRAGEPEHPATLGCELVSSASSSTRLAVLERCQDEPADRLSVLNPAPKDNTEPDEYGSSCSPISTPASPVRRSSPSRVTAPPSTCPPDPRRGPGSASSTAPARHRHAPGTGRCLRRFEGGQGRFGVLVVDGFTGDRPWRNRFRAPVDHRGGHRPRRADGGPDRWSPSTVPSPCTTCRPEPRCVGSPWTARASSHRSPARWWARAARAARGRPRRPALTSQAVGLKVTRSAPVSQCATSCSASSR